MRIGLKNKMIKFGSSDKGFQFSAVARHCQLCMKGSWDFILVDRYMLIFRIVT